MITEFLNLQCDAVSGENSTKWNFDSTRWNSVVLRDAEQLKHCMVLGCLV